MRRLLLAAALGGLLVGLAVLGAGWRLWTAPGPGRGDALVRVRIPAGATWRAAADSLQAHGLLERPRVLVLGARFSGRGRDLRAGLYDLPAGAAPRRLLDLLTRGSAVQLRVTLPEGLDADETAARLAADLGLDPARFLAAADSLVRERALAAASAEAAAFDSLVSASAEAGPRRLHWCEGYLAPDTYLFGEGVDAAAVAGHLVRTQWARLDSVRRLADAEAAGWSDRQVLALASLVEAEARRDDERPLIAAVYRNRLAARWRLEADPTVAFLLDKKGQRLFYRDLEVASPFNTYRHRGLPPGAIGNPGWASLLAAVRPDAGCRAMYFVSDGQDGHVFSRTAREHEEAVARFRSLRAAARRGEAR